MSWDAYTKALVDTGKITSAAIHGFPDGGLWAQSNLALTGTQAAVLAQRFADPGTGAKLEVAGVSYMALKCDTTSLSGKKETDALVIAHSDKAMIIAVCGNGLNPGNGMVAIQNMCEDLKSKGF